MNQRLFEKDDFLQKRGWYSAVKFGQGPSINNLVITKPTSNKYVQNGQLRCYCKPACCH